jgi:leucyl/phenylalanyl-tRNA--protein transferase
MFILPPDSRDLRFPPAHLASPEGLLAIGGDLRAERLIEAYRHGIFPWYSEGQPILWWSPDPRAVLFPGKLKISRSLRKTLRAAEFTVTMDTRFREVMQACAAPREQYPDGGTWITPEMLDAYLRLHEQGLAHSVEVWRHTGTHERDVHGRTNAASAGYAEAARDRQDAVSGRDGELVGGLYGVALGAAFFGESMFSRASDASKVALAHLSGQLAAWGFRIIDCQLPSPHLFSLGAEEIPRREFMAYLDEALKQPDRRGPWRFDEAFVSGWASGTKKT